MKTAQPLPTLLDEHRPVLDRMAVGWRESRHIVVISHPGRRVLTAARYLAASEPGPVSFADRWAVGVCQTITRNRPIQDGPPLRAPHHTASFAGLLGGGNRQCMRPGECTLAHRGVLYLDQLADFSRSALQGIAEAMTKKRATLYRGEHTITFPADFRVIGVDPGCPCGYFGHPTRHCTCSSAAVRRHRRRMTIITQRDDVSVVDLNQTVGGHCNPDCRGWFPSHSDEYGMRIERCDDCAHASGTCDTYQDDNAERDAAAWVAESIIMQSTDSYVDDVIAALRGTCGGRKALAHACGGVGPEHARRGVAANHG